jgi:hypothetical protein
MLKQNPKRAGIVETLRYFYESDARSAQRFRYALVAFDIVTILFIVATSFVPNTPVLERLDVAFGIVILLDFLARLAISRNRLRELIHPASLADMAAIVSFLAKRRASCGSYARSGSCTPTSFSPGYGRTAAGSAATRR